MAKTPLSQPATNPGPLILASSSPYRRQLLDRLGLDYRVISPAVDESGLPAEPAEQRVTRLAAAKAQAVAVDHPDAVVIGSDQLASHGERILGKPGNVEAACRQLRAFSRQQVIFHTSVCVRSRDFEQQLNVPTTVCFRDLSDTEIRAYVTAERPLDCAGAFKAEGLGITLFQWIRSDDPTALIGLPLIATCRLLRLTGFVLPAAASRTPAE